MATFIPPTPIVNNQPATLYVNVDQIVRIGDSVGGGPGLPDKCPAREWSGRRARNDRGHYAVDQPAEGRYREGTSQERVGRPCPCEASGRRSATGILPH